MSDLMDLLGIAGILLVVYIVYNVCRVDERMCGIGVFSLIFMTLAYAGRYVEIDRWTLAAIMVVAVGFVLLWIGR